MFVSSGNQIPQRGVGTKKKIFWGETRIPNWRIDEMREGGGENFASGVVGVNRVWSWIVGWLGHVIGIGERERVRGWLGGMGASSLRTRRQWRLWRRRRSLRGVGFCLTPQGKAPCSTSTNMPSCIGFIFMRVISESLIPCSLTPPPFSVVRRPLFLTWRYWYIFFPYCFLFYFCFFNFVLLLLILCFSILRQLSPLKRLVSHLFILKYVTCLLPSLKERD